MQESERNSLSLLDLTLVSHVSSFDSILDVYEDSESSLYCLKKVENSLASDRFSFLTTLKHPCLLKYYHLTDQQNGEVAEEYCPLGSLSDLIQAQHKFSANDLLCILTQLVYLFDFLLKKRLCPDDFTSSDVFVSSINPICIKVSLLSSTKGFNSDNRPRFSLQVIDSDLDELHLDPLIVEKLISFMTSFIDHSDPESIFSCSTDDLKSLKSLLLCSIRLRNFKKNINIVNCVDNYFSTSLLSKRVQIISMLFLSNPLISHVFIQGICRFDKPIFKYDIYCHGLTCINKYCSKFASKIINVSTTFRHLFRKCLNLCYVNSGHILDLTSQRNGGVRFSIRPNNYMLRTSFSKTNNLSARLVDSATCKWLNKFPITCIATNSLANIGNNLSLFPSVSSVELFGFREDLTSLSNFPNLNDLCMYDLATIDGKILSPLKCLFKLHSLVLHFLVCTPFDVCLLGNLKQLTSLSLHRFIINDLAPISSLENLSSLSLKGSKIYDLLPLQHLPNLSYLDLRETPLSREFRIIVRGCTEVKKVVNSFTDIIHLDLSDYNPDVCLDLSQYVKHFNLKSLDLANATVSNLQLIPTFKHLEELNLSNVVENYLGCDPIADVSFLSLCTRLKSLALNGSFVSNISILSTVKQLTSLSLRDSRVGDLWPLYSLIKLSYLDVRDSHLPKFHQALVTGNEEVKALVTKYDPQVSIIHENTFNFSLTTNCTDFQLISLTYCFIQNISLLSSFINLEHLDLSGVNVFENNEKLEDISFVSSCTRLKSLCLDNTGVHDLSPLSSLSKLTYLSLKNTIIFDLSPLLNVVQLSFLDVRNTPMPQQKKLLSGLSRVREFIIESNLVVGKRRAT
ncbi:hypothetical protein RCL1_007537 [Eukaryota sp. TZLM3-RCL]